MLRNDSADGELIKEKRRAMTSCSPNPNLKNYQNEKINLNVNCFAYLYGKRGKGYPLRSIILIFIFGNKIPNTVIC
jgi:hypothetical protein